MLYTKMIGKKEKAWKMSSVLVLLVTCILYGCVEQQRPKYPCTLSTFETPDELSTNVRILLVDPATQDLRIITQEEALQLAEEGGILENVVIEGTDPTTGRSTSVPLKDALIARDCDSCFKERLAQCESTPIPPLAEECCHCLFLWLLGDPCLPKEPPSVVGCDVIVCWKVDGKLYCYCGYYA